MSLLAAYGSPLRVCSPSLSSGLKVKGTQPSFQPRVLQEEEDRESGIGSTLDLSGSFENDNRRTNHRSSTLPHWEAGGHPEGKGTGAATRVAHHHLPFKEKGQSAQDRTTRSLDKDRLRRHTRGQSCCVFNKGKVPLSLSSAWLQTGESCTLDGFPLCM